MMVVRGKLPLMAKMVPLPVEREVVVVVQPEGLVVVVTFQRGVMYQDLQTAEVAGFQVAEVLVSILVLVVVVWAAAAEVVYPALEGGVVTAAAAAVVALKTGAPAAVVPSTMAATKVI